MKKQVFLILACTMLAMPFQAEAATIEAGSTRAGAVSGPGAANWERDETGWVYRYADGTCARSEWILSSGKWYYMGETGYMKTGLLTLDGITYYLEDETGAMVSSESRVVNGITYDFDESGIGSMQWAFKQPLAVPPEAEKTEFHKNVDAMADSVLAGIIHDGMNQREKATAIYWWVKQNMTYSGFSPVGDWVNGAYDGLRRHRGDCYTYYSLSAELLTRAGFQTIEVIRSSDNNHYWNLVNVDGAWYHFDPCPRRNGGEWCLVTDAQLAGQSSHVFDHSLYPPTP